jgi:hypothetical protein
MGPHIINAQGERKRVGDTGRGAALLNLSKGELDEARGELVSNVLRWTNVQRDEI